MSYISGFNRPSNDDDEYYKALASRTKKPDEIEAWERPTEKKSKPSKKEEDSKKKRKLIEDSASEDSGDEDHGSRPEESEKDSEDEPPLTDADFPDELKDIDAFQEFYKDTVKEVWSEKVTSPSTADWDAFKEAVFALSKSSGVELDTDESEFVMVHVCCTMYSKKKGITVPKWEKIKHMKKYYDKGLFPRMICSDEKGGDKNKKDKKKRRKLEIEESDDDDASNAEPEKNAYTFLQAHDITSLPLAMILQQRAVLAGDEGTPPRFGELIVYEHDTLVPHLCGALIEYVKDLTNPRIEIADDEPVRWSKHIFEDDVAMNNRIISHKNIKDLKMKLKISNCDPGDENWFKQVKFEIAKRCGLRFNELYPGRLKRDELNRPIYTINEIPEMKVVYQNVLSALKL